MAKKKKKKGKKSKKELKKERAAAFAEQQRAAKDKARTVEVIEAQLAEVQTQLCWERNEERAAELEQQEARGGAEGAR